MPDNEWQPSQNMPDAKGDFNEAQQKKETPEHVPTSKLELDRLEAEKQKEQEQPKPEYRPQGIDRPVQQYVDKKAQGDRENRINEIYKSFETYKSRARDDFNMNADEHSIKKAEKENERSR